jgi:hypothetical protein
VRRVAPLATRLQRSPAAPYVAAVGVRTAARAAWGIGLPAALSITAYGRYQVIATAGAMIAQVALLGTPQTLVRYSGQRLPMRLLAAHAAALAAVGACLAIVAVPTLRLVGGPGALVALVAAAVAATMLGAQAKARFAFRTSLVGEAAGAAVLVIATAAAVVSTTAWTPTRVALIEAVALAVTAGALLVRRPAPVLADAAPAPRRVFASIYSVGLLALLDVVLLRRLEIYFLERSPSGLTGVAVLGLSLQIATVALLVPAALLEAWQPRFAVLSSGSRAAFDREVARRRRHFGILMAAVTIVGVAVPLIAVPLVFPQYSPWLGYIVLFVAVRIVCAGAGFHSAILYAAGRHRALYGSAIVTAAVAIGANAALTRPFGLPGAAIAYTLTQITVATLTVTAFRRAAARDRTLDSAVKAAA